MFFVLSPGRIYKNNVVVERRKTHNVTIETCGTYLLQNPFEYSGRTTAVKCVIYLRRSITSYNIIIREHGNVHLFEIPRQLPTV